MSPADPVPAPVPSPVDHDPGGPQVCCRLCSAPITRDATTRDWVSGDRVPCPARREGGLPHLPPMCYCGGPEEQVYGHVSGSGRYCRREVRRG